LGWNPEMTNLLPTLQNSRLLNLEMGIATLYILASLYELRAGAILAVFNNPLTGEFTVGAGVKKKPSK
jgi:uridine phosphorylase